MPANPGCADHGRRSLFYIRLPDRLPPPRTQHRIEHFDVVGIALGHALQIQTIDFPIAHHDHIIVDINLRIARALYPRHISAALSTSQRVVRRLIAEHLVMQSNGVDIAAVNAFGADVVIDIVGGIDAQVRPWRPRQHNAEAAFRSAGLRVGAQRRRDHDRIAVDLVEVVPGVRMIRRLIESSWRHDAAELASGIRDAGRAECTGGDANPSAGFGPRHLNLLINYSLNHSNSYRGIGALAALVNRADQSALDNYRQSGICRPSAVASRRQTFKPLGFWH